MLIKCRKLFQRLIIPISLFLWGMVAVAEELKVNYIANFRYHHIHCNFMINGVSIHSTLDTRPVMMSFSDRVGALLAEGDNTFGIEAMNIPMDPSEAYCEVILTVMGLIPRLGAMSLKKSPP